MTAWTRFISLWSFLILVYQLVNHKLMLKIRNKMRGKNLFFKCQLLAILFFMVLSNKSWAQQRTTTFLSKRIHAEVRAGFTSSNLATPYNDDIRSSASKTGFYGGLVLEYPLSEILYLRPGFIVTSKGGKLDVDYEGDKAMTLNGVYFQVPIYFSAKLSLERYNNSINLNVGPYVAYGFAGNMSYKPRGSNTPYSSSSFGKNGPLNRLDVGLGGECQFEYHNKIIFTLGSEVGMTRAVKNGVVDGISDVIGNSVGYLSVGYKF